MPRTRAAIVALILLVLTGVSRAGAENAKGRGHWVSAWSTAVHAPLPFPGLPPTPTLENQTIRMVVRPTIGGDRLRIRPGDSARTRIVAALAKCAGRDWQYVPDAPADQNAKVVQEIRNWLRGQK